MIDKVGLQNFPNYCHKRRKQEMNTGGVTMSGAHGHNGFFSSGFSLVGAQPQQVTNFSPNACRRCGHDGCDIKIKPCGCHFHVVSGRGTARPAFFLS